ncbi:hypothetical protein FGO68_gene3254 [Halteria grandinella]|uniref:Uncharacterized protein n=1 Tax=Halteria grandinella TaxID=5974 RepID=A0A8J8NTM3_HALGN|nr:hypothetical protein FGO68_gene3254 [Halteria grandinella]
MVSSKFQSIRFARSFGFSSSILATVVLAPSKSPKANQHLKSRLQAFSKLGLMTKAFSQSAQAFLQSFILMQAAALLLNRASDLL